MSQAPTAPPEQTSLDRLKSMKAVDTAHHYHPFSDERMLKQYGPLMVVKAQGTRLYVEQGIQLLDMVAGLGCVNIGYGQAAMADAIAEAVRELSFYHTFQQASNPYAAALAQTLARLTPDHLNKAFFANSGSEANETIVKLVRAYWRRRGRPDKTDIITREFSYHGSTLYTASMNGLAHMHQAFGLPLAGILHVPASWWYRNGGDQDPDAYGKRAALAIEEKILQVGADRVGALFLEPIQVTAGAVIAPGSYWPEVQRIVQEHDVLLAVDEVVTGFGRCGRWILHDALGMKADFVTLAKGLTSAYQPLAAAMVSDRVMEVVNEGGALQHGYTTSGHPVACAAAIKNIEILHTQEMVTRAGGKLGQHFQDRMASLSDHPLVGEVRGHGLLAGIELAADKASRRQFPLEQGVCNQGMQAVLVKGIIIRAVGNALVLCPPLSISVGEIDFCTTRLREALDEVWQKVKAG